MSGSLPRPQVPQLPTEICEEIISSLYDKKTLGACSLVCHSWLPRSRAQLYWSAQVGGIRIHMFLDTIMVYPHLGVNVKQLFLWDINGDSPDIYRFFSDIIPLLPKIASLEYKSLPIPYLHLPLFPSGLRFLTSLTLWRIEADSFGDIVRFVSYHKHLKQLTITLCSWKRSRVHHYRFGVRWGRDLQKLTFNRCEYQRVFDILQWLGRSNSPCSIQCLEITNVNFLEQNVVPFIADHLAIQWATTMKAIYLDFDRGTEKAGDAKEAVVSSLTAYIRFCPNLHTVRLYISEETLWVLRQLPDVLSGLVSLCHIAFRFQTWAEAGVVFLGDYEKTWTTVDKDMGDGAKFKSLEYVEVLCEGGPGTEVPSWWENDTGSSEDGEMDKSNGKDGETESREECNNRAMESLREETGRQRQGVPSNSGVELGSYAHGTLPYYNLYHTMNGVANFHRRQKPLTDVFPHLSARGVLWCAINHVYPFPPPLHITASNLKGMKSHNWRPRYCESSFDKPLDYS